MSQSIRTDYFHKSSFYKLNVGSLIMFIVAVLITWEFNIIGQIVFRAPDLLPFITRTTIILVSDIALLAASYQLLKYNNIPFTALGLDLSKRTLMNFLIGIAIGVTTIFIIAFLFRLIVPYHFAYSSLNGVKILRECYSYLLGAFLEELIFRGFLVLIFSQLIGWRLSLLIMALPFGLFHLQGGNGGLSIVITTTMYSFIFGLSFILTRSLWTAIATHSTINILLHLLTGLDGGGKAVYNPVLEKALPYGYITGLLVSIIGVMISCTLLYAIVLKIQRQLLYK